MVRQIKELSYASCISIQQVKETIKHLDEVGCDVGGIPFNVCTEYNEYQNLAWFHIVICPVGSLYHSDSIAYENHTDGNLLYRTQSVINTQGGK